MSKLSEQLQQHFRAPALDLRDGRIVEGEIGDTHADIMDGLSPSDQRIPNIGHGFVDHNSNFHNRESARLFLRRRGVNIPDVPDEGPSSEMLRGDFDGQYPNGYPQSPPGPGVGAKSLRPSTDHQRSPSVWYQSGQRTIYRFANGYGASLVGPDSEGRIQFAPIKFTDDPNSPFFIHYSTPVGGPRTLQTPSEVQQLLDQLSGLDDETVKKFTEGVMKGGR